jgi:hypothetical protein
MRKYIYARLYFDPTGKTGLANIYATDQAVLDWVFAYIKKQIPGCIITWEGHDLNSVRSEFQLDQLENKDRELINSIVKLLCESGFEPYAHDANYMHFRKGND